jgi:hypothetical protein
VKRSDNGSTALAAGEEIVLLVRVEAAGVDNTATVGDR